MSLNLKVVAARVNDDFKTCASCANLAVLGGLKLEFFCLNRLTHARLSWRRNSIKGEDHLKKLKGQKKPKNVLNNR